MTAIWPAHLPQYPLRDSRDDTYEQAIREFLPDTGDPIRRKNQTATRPVFFGTYRMTGDQRKMFWDFFNGTINRGVDRFMMPDPTEKLYVAVRFLDPSPPRFRPAGRRWRDVTLVFRVIG